MLVDVGEFSYADAPRSSGIPIGTVMSRLYRGRRLLKQRLAERPSARAAGVSVDPCHGRRALLQPCLDRALTRGRGQPGSTVFLRDCDYCNERYIFEAQPARRSSRTVCCGDPVPADLVDRLRLRCCGQDDVA